MRIIDVVPKDISVITEFSVQEIQDILFCMEHCVVEIDKKDVAASKSVEYFSTNFYDTLQKLNKRLQNAD
jgi:hypothetical protein